MPGVYREKICPTCKISHKKRGPYCSRSCGNIRVHSEETKEKLSAMRKEYFNTPEGIADRALKSKQTTARNMNIPYDALSTEDFAIDIPDISHIHTIAHNEFIDGRDIWIVDEDLT